MNQRRAWILILRTFQFSTIIHQIVFCPMGPEEQLRTVEEWYNSDLVKYFWSYIHAFARRAPVSAYCMMFSVLIHCFSASGFLFYNQKVNTSTLFSIRLNNHSELFFCSDWILMTKSGLIADNNTWLECFIASLNLEQREHDSVQQK